MAIFKRVKITEETVEKEESGSLIPPRASFFSLPYLVRSISIQLNDYAVV